MPDFQPRDKAQVVMTLGDRKPDGKLDVTVEVFSVIPLFKEDQPIKVMSFTVDSHLEDLPKLAAGVTALLGPLASGSVAAAIGAASKLAINK